MKPEKWLRIFIALLLSAVVFVMALTAWLDPFFHFHGPLNGFYYRLYNERSQNDGIVKRFDYDALVTGTSVAQNFRTSEMDALFDCHAVKVCFSGATFRELADIMDTAFSVRDIRCVVSVANDVSNTFIQDKDYRQESFDYPEYLYNDSLIDDVHYLLNRDVLAEYVMPMLWKKLRGVPGGITSFDDYSKMDFSSRGIQSFGNMTYFVNRKEQKPLDEADAQMVRDNVEQNILRLAREHPETTFCLFIPPVSIARWGQDYYEGEALRKIDAEAVGIGMLVACDNIRVYSFSTDESIICDADHYHDRTHYTEEINSMILSEMARADSPYLLTEENLDAYIADLKSLFLAYDYEGLRYPE